MRISPSHKQPESDPSMGLYIGKSNAYDELYRYGDRYLVTRTKDDKAAGVMFFIFAGINEDAALDRCMLALIQAMPWKCVHGHAPYSPE